MGAPEGLFITATSVWSKLAQTFFLETLLKLPSGQRSWNRPNAYTRGSSTPGSLAITTHI
eukprot:1864403-Amphidinium_carterae.1